MHVWQILRQTSSEKGSSHLASWLPSSNPWHFMAFIIKIHFSILSPCFIAKPSWIIYWDIGYLILIDRTLQSCCPHTPLISWYLLAEDFVHHSLVGRVCITQLKGNHVILVIDLLHHECYFLFIIPKHRYLVVYKKSIHKWQ